MRLKKLAATTLFGALLALPALAQTTNGPAVTAPGKPAATMPSTAAPVAPMAAPMATAPMTHPATPMATMPAAAAVNLNTATPDQLDSLPGIGKARAKKIIAARPYKSVDELGSKKVVPHSVFEKIKDKVTV